mmetsp:Transcript_63103/g.162489  ORF Transcript_63103/g.162489 Transcript_63103/m.162489 type:complete len:466 (+) Transcript_63103:55-1452(+)|eukprot:CAMPEP_0195077612 /NCGR_PEP_ID=MMETSP0448-20130528/20001_1 /TAXON_ID=66468 /ORGANISM="Heterocapsa triquestra, Strain CCMP 448" /LENGTH=465 /DNA_ID=CAMNT_0040110271 /DNA_START=55 /DNA_END=1452 /DNA_ORIENTATION=-
MSVAAGWRSATTQLMIVGGLAFCGPGIFNALQGLGAAGSDDPMVGAVASGCLYCTFAIFGYFGGAAFTFFGAKPLFTLGGLTFAIYAICIYFTSHWFFLAAVGGICLGIGAGLFWTAQGALMMAYATPQNRGRMIALFWILFNLGGMSGGVLQFGMNFNNTSRSANPLSYFSFVIVMLLGACSAPFLLAPPDQVVREDGTHVAFEKPKTPWEEIVAAVQAIKDPFVVRCLPFFFASNWFYTYDFSGFNGTQFNIRTRGLNSALFWMAQMLAAWLFGSILDSNLPARRRAWHGIVIVFFLQAIPLALAYWITVASDCGNGAGQGWDKGMPCRLDVVDDFPGVSYQMVVFFFLGAGDAVYQNFAYWLMSTAAGDNVTKTVAYSAIYKGVQSLGAGIAWLSDIPDSMTYRRQCLIAITITLGSMIPIIPTFKHLENEKKGATDLEDSTSESTADESVDTSASNETSSA